MHIFDRINVKKNGDDLPEFVVTSENEKEKIKFTVTTYSHLSWTFKKRSLGFIPCKLVYNEYPAVISDFVLEDKSSGKKISQKDLGKSIGNAGHRTGLLL